MHFIIEYDRGAPVKRVATPDDPASARAAGEWLHGHLAPAASCSVS